MLTDEFFLFLLYSPPFFPLVQQVKCCASLPLIHQILIAREFLKRKIRKPPVVFLRNSIRPRFLFRVPTTYRHYRPSWNNLNFLFLFRSVVVWIFRCAAISVRKNLKKKKTRIRIYISGGKYTRDILYTTARGGRTRTPSSLESISDGLDFFFFLDFEFFLCSGCSVRVCLSVWNTCGISGAAM